MAISQAPSTHGRSRLANCLQKSHRDHLQPIQPQQVQPEYLPRYPDSPKSRSPTYRCGGSTVTTWLNSSRRKIGRKKRASGNGERFIITTIMVTFASAVGIRSFTSVVTQPSQIYPTLAALRGASLSPDSLLPATRALRRSTFTMSSSSASVTIVKQTVSPQSLPIIHIAWAVADITK